jgi:hypothetical protein
MIFLSREIFDAVSSNLIDFEWLIVPRPVRQAGFCQMNVFRKTHKVSQDVWPGFPLFQTCKEGNERRSGSLLAANVCHSYLWKESMRSAVFGIVNDWT